MGSSASSSKLSPRQYKAVMLLSTGATNDQAASVAGVRGSTVSGWMREEAFRDELRLAMERMRQIFEGRIMGLASNAAAIVQQLMQDQDLDRRAEGAKLALTAAVRLVTRYKELQVEGFVPPSQPLVIFPEGTKMPWNSSAPALPSGDASFDEVIDVEADVVEPTEPDIDTQ